MFYRPISLLSLVVKVFERLLLPFINEALPRAKKQHRLAPAHSTVTALCPLVKKVAQGFNQKKPPVRTATVAVDIAKSFDSVDHNLLLDMVAYLRGRTASCHFQGAKATPKIIHTGVPHGSVLSPSLINYFVSNFPHVAMLTLSYADDFTVSELSADVDALGRKLTQHFEVISLWAKSKGLKVEPS